MLAIDQTGELNRKVTATEIYSLCENADIAIPGLRDGADEDKAKRVIGTVRPTCSRMVTLWTWTATRSGATRARSPRRHNSPPKPDSGKH